MERTRQNTKVIRDWSNRFRLWEASEAAVMGWTEEEDECHFQYALANNRGDIEAAKYYAEKADRLCAERHERERRGSMREVFRSGAYSVRRLPGYFTVPRWFLYHNEEEITICNTLKGAKSAIAFMQRLEAAATVEAVSRVA